MNNETTINFKLFFIIILMMFTVGLLASDLYVPSLPAITTTLHSTRSTIQWSISVYMLGLSGSQLIYGPLSDHYGRKVIILIGIIIGIIGTIICLYARSPQILIVGRLIQGLGLGAGAVLGRAIMRDVLSGKNLAKIGSVFGLFTTIVVGSAPILGGYFQHYLGWRSVFIFLSVYSILLWIVIFIFLRETNTHAKKNKLNLSDVFAKYWTLLKNRVFLGYVLCTTFACSGLIAFYTMSPFLLQNRVGLSPVAYGWSCAFITIATIIGSIINVRLVNKMGINSMMIAGSILIIIAGTSMLAAALLGYMNEFVIVVPAAIYAFGAIFLLCNAFAGALTPFPHMAGIAAALYGATQIGGGFASSALIATMKFSNQEPLAIIYLALGIFGILAITQLAMKGKKDKNVQ